MLYITKIRMQSGCMHKPELTEVDEVLLEGIGFHRKEAVFDFLVMHPGAIRVGMEPWPEVMPVTSGRCEKYICSGSDMNNDLLLALPLEAVGTGTDPKKTVAPLTV